MRILLLNPNMTASVTDLMLEAGRSVAAAGTDLVPLTAERGVPYISSRAEAQIGGHVALEMLADQVGRVDAAIIAAFGDPGVGAARELFDYPVVGVSEAAMLTACLLGRTFALVTFASGFTGWYRDCVEQTGMSTRCVGIHALDLPDDAMGRDLGDRDSLILPRIEAVARDSGADSLVFAGAPLAGLARRLRAHIPLPVVDPVGAAVKQAEALVALAPGNAKAGSYRRPPPKSTSGLTESLAARIEHRDLIQD